MILLVEDNEQNAYLATFLLEQAGLKVRRASTGEEALRLAREQTHELILLDIRLPDLDGYEIAQRLRSDPGFKTPIVAMTSYAMAGEKRRAMHTGCDGYLEKPISPATFVEQVRGFLKAA